MKLILFSALFFLLILSQASAITTDMKEVYKQKETIVIKISGNIASQINPEQIFFKRANVFVPLEYDVARVGNNWYIWATSPSVANNYTLYIEDISVQSGFGVESEDYQKNFSVSNEISSYNVKPGFIVTNDNFDLEVEVNDNQEHEIEVDFPTEKNVNLQIGMNDLNFPIDSISNSQFKIIKVGVYEIPAYITVVGSTPINENNTAQSNNNTNITSQNQTATIFSKKLKASPQYIQKFLYWNGMEQKYYIDIINENNFTYKNVRVVYNTSIFEVNDDKFDINSGNNHTLVLTVDGKYSANISEIIYINGTNFSMEIPFIIRFSNNATRVASFYGQVIKNGTNGSIRKTNALCTEFGAFVCSDNSICKGEVLEGRDGTCCLGTCQKPQGKSYAWLGWIIALVVLGAGWFAYYKYKKAGT